MSAVVTVNPATGERLAEYPAFSDAEVDAALDAAVGIREFANVRTWWVLDEPAVTAPASE
jgi:acyl-CoA reductase-like NAD-dependent aldehyde dehydrogenase